MSLNEIQNIEPLRQLKSLRELRLHGNRIKALRPTLDVLQSMSALERVQLRSLETHEGNPCCDLPAYRTQLLAALPSARVLDGEVLLLTGAAEALALPPEPDLGGITEVPGPSLAEMLDNEEARSSAGKASALGAGEAGAPAGESDKLKETERVLDACSLLDREAEKLLEDAAKSLGVER